MDIRAQLEMSQEPVWHLDNGAETPLTVQVTYDMNPFAPGSSYGELICHNRFSPETKSCGATVQIKPL